MSIIHYYEERGKGPLRSARLVKLGKKFITIEDRDSNKTRIEKKTILIRNIEEEPIPQTEK
ncbi:MAG: hypothetical protein JXI43_11680 [Tissierellales bacterium]|nr:hypothetical protein [Tissierellales bacterium]